MKDTWCACASDTLRNTWFICMFIYLFYNNNLQHNEGITNTHFCTYCHLLKARMRSERENGKGREIGREINSSAVVFRFFFLSYFVSLIFCVFRLATQCNECTVRCLRIDGYRWTPIEIDEELSVSISISHIALLIK